MSLQSINLRVRLETFSIVWALAVMAACVSTGQTSAHGQSGIEGVITVSPAKPGPVRVDAPDSAPLDNASFVVENEKGEAASFTTDQNGHFRVLVPPGHYKVSLKGRKSSIGHFGPFEVDVAAGKMTNVQWKCDSGIR
jgi:Carboxypeptidase regulatory-like domain